MSGEKVTATRTGGAFVVVADAWMERENNGHGIDTTTGGHDYSAGPRPALAGYKAHAMRFAVSTPSGDPALLAATIHELPFEGP